MVSKPDHHIGDRLRHPHRRMVRSGEEFYSEEAERGEVELEEREPTRGIQEERSEPWNYTGEEPADAVERLRRYRAFLDERGYDRARDERGDS